MRKWPRVPHAFRRLGALAQAFLVALFFQACGSSSAPATPTSTVTTGPTNGAPTITTQPQSQSIAPGQTATLTVGASGTAPLSYQWFAGTSGNTASLVASATASNYTTPALTTTTAYWVRVSNPAGAVNSATATLTVGTATISGRLLSNPSGNPIAGAQIVDSTRGGTLATTDSSGAFSFQYEGPASFQVTVQAAGHATRLTRIARSTHGVTIDLISLAPPFDPTFYRQLARNAKDLNGSFDPRGLVVWPGNPSFYIRTELVDPGQNFSDTGRPVPGHAIDLTVSGIPVIVSEVTAGRLQPGSIEMGTDLRHQSEPGWIVIQFFDRGTNPQAYSGIGGNASIGGGVAGTVLVGVYTSPPNGYYCASGIGQGLIFHETGHALGLFHIPSDVDSPNIMGGGLGASCDVVHFSALERFHSAIMYLRPRGNLDPDSDPSSFSYLSSPR